MRDDPATQIASESGAMVLPRITASSPSIVMKIPVANSKPPMISPATLSALP